MVISMMASLFASVVASASASASSLFLQPGISADPIRFLIGFILVCCVIAVVIILAKWLAGLAGVTIPPPLMLVLGILIFIFLILWLLNWSGIYRF